MSSQFRPAQLVGSFREETLGQGSTQYSGEILTRKYEGPIIRRERGVDLDNNLVPVRTWNPTEDVILQQDIVIQSPEQQPEGFFHEAYRHVLKPVGVGIAAPIGGVVTGVGAIAGGVIFGAFSIVRGAAGIIPLSVDWVVKPVGAGFEVTVDWCDDKVKWMLGQTKEEPAQLMIKDGPAQQDYRGKGISMMYPSSSYTLPPTAYIPYENRMVESNAPFESRRMEPIVTSYSLPSSGNLPSSRTGLTSGLDHAAALG